MTEALSGKTMKHKTGITVYSASHESVVKPASGASQYGWTWSIIRAGDCTMHDGSLIMYPNGTAHFTAEIESTDDGDVWIVRYIDIFDGNGNSLYRFPQMDGPVMNDEGGPRFYMDFWVNYPIHVWNDLDFTNGGSANMTYHC